MGKIVDLTGTKIDMLTVMYRTDDYIQSSCQHKRVHCKCDCGNECEVYASHLKKRQVIVGAYFRRKKVERPYFLLSAEEEETINKKKKKKEKYFKHRDYMQVHLRLQVYIVYKFHFYFFT